MSLSRMRLQVPRPRTFLYLMSLRTGTELIALSLLLNKISGIYGLLALLTGVSLSPLQLSMYIYSVLALILTAYLSRHIRKQSPLQNLALAWFYIIDSIINALYTAAFAMTWFLVISQHQAGRTGDIISGPGNAGKTIDDTAGFTSPEHNVTHVDVVATPAKGLTTGQDAVAIGTPSSSMAAMGTKTPSLGHGVLQPESMTSLIVICSLWALRMYFVFVVMAYARSVLRRHISTSYDTGLAMPRKPESSSSTSSRPNPFASTTREGQGWPGRLGRVMIAVGRGYWLGGGADEDESWAVGLTGKFRKDEEDARGGLMERERRRRSGTGPPLPSNLQVPRWQTGVS
ncbi:MAG: hypothetical protein M1823_005090 [Watsoniomyces obsoletus]|nr:MAG: hypothetical protein M1823_005090 [Watsoniomyces obsoletus]